jgi:thymidylate synthase, flavin-dependent
MKIITQNAEIVNAPDYNTMLSTVEQAIRNCYQSQSAIKEGSAEKIITSCIGWKHNSVLEFADITVRLITDRSVLAQITRQRLTSLAVESMRYCNYSKDRFDHEIKVIMPENLSVDAYNTWKNAVAEAEKSYFEMIDVYKMSAEVARSILPHCTATTIVMKANIREWRHIFELRCDSHAQKDIRMLITNVLEQFYNKYPVFFKDLYEQYVVNNEEYAEYKSRN